MVCFWFFCFSYSEYGNFMERSGFFFLHFLTFLALIYSADSISQTSNETFRVARPESPSNAVEYVIPPVSERAEVLDETEFSLKNITLTMVVSDVSGSVNERTVDEPSIQNLISDTLTTWGHRATMSRLESLTKSITNYYRNRGEFLTTAYIPSQKVVDGNVNVVVLAGVLGKVEAEGNELYKDKFLIGAFDNLVGEIVDKESAESALLLVQKRVSGVTPFGAFEAGESLGLTNLIVNVRNEEHYRPYLFIDNAGSESTGRNRLGGHLDIFNLLGVNDNLGIDFLFNEEPNGLDSGSICCYGGFRYEYVGSNLKTSYGMEISLSRYDVGDDGDLELSVFELSGESFNVRLYGSYINHISRSFQSMFSYGISRTRAKQEGRLNNLDDIGQFDVGYEFSHFGSGVTFGSIRLYYEPESASSIGNVLDILGHDDDANADSSRPPSRLNTDGKSSFRTRINLNYVQNFWDKFSGRLSLRGQYSSDALAPVQQLGLGGAQALRAYPAGIYLADKGGIASFDLMYSYKPAPGYQITPNIFLEYGYGTTNNPEGVSGDPQTANALGAGMGLLFDYKSQIAVSMSLAWQLRDHEGTDPLSSRELDDDRSPMFYGSLVYKF